MKKISTVIVQTNRFGISKIKLNDVKSYNSLSFKMIKSLIKALKI